MQSTFLRFYSDSELILKEIQNLKNKKESLLAINSYSNYRDIKIYFTATSPSGENEIVWVHKNMLPFDLSNELKILLEDSIDQINQDIASLEFQLKNA